MNSTADSDNQGIEVSVLLDEIEQLRTALEASLGEAATLGQDRDRLRGELTRKSRRILASHGARANPVSPDPGLSPAPAVHTQEELRVALEEMQVLTEELEVANESLRAVNRTLDRRVEERTRELARSELRFRRLVEGMPQLVWRALDGGAWTWASPQWSAYTGLTTAESLGQGWLQAVHPDDRAGAAECWAKAKGGNTLECGFRLANAAGDRYRHFQTRAVAVREADGSLLEWIGTSTDVDDLLRLQEHQAVLVAELQHRTRNLMALVQSILARTLKRSTSLAEFEASIGARLAALSRVQGLLSRRGERQRIPFETLIREELSAHIALDEHGKGDQVSITGPRDIRLRATTVQLLALAIHELATNAVKYGALSTPEGRLEVTWGLATTSGRLGFRMDWRESGYHPALGSGAQQPGGGYGRELIERALPYQLSAKVNYALGEDGLSCSIEMPLAD